MAASALIFRPRLRAVAGTVSTVVVLGGIAFAGAVLAVAAVAVIGSVAGGLYVWSRTSSGRMRGSRRLYR